MAIFESTSFIFNGINSTDLNLTNIHVDTGLYDEPFISTLELYETKVLHKNRPYFTLLKRHPFQFKVTFGLTDYVDDSVLAKIARAFYTDNYVPMTFSRFTDRIYYCLPINDIHFLHTGNNIGYFQIEFRCDDYCAFSPVFTTQIYDLTTNPVGGTTITLTNTGDLPIYPVVYVQIISGSTFSIINNSNGAQSMSFSGLNINENLTISGQDQEIDTDQSLTYRYSAMAGDFTQLVRGVNNLQVTGNIKIQFAMEFKILQS